MPGLDLGRAPCPVHIPTKDRASLLPNPLGSCIGLSGGGVVIRVVGGWNIAFRKTSGDSGSRSSGGLGHRGKGPTQWSGLGVQFSWG